MSLTIIKGTILSAPTLGQLDALPGGYLVAEDGLIRGVYGSLPEQYAGAPVEDWGDALILQSFADLHLHAPQYPMLGMGMDLPLLDWLNAYAFPTEARFADTGYAREIYSRLARELIANGTTRVCMFSSLHTDATLILMEELEKAGVTGYVGKVNMDRNAAPGLLEETTEESRRETLRWLDACQDFRLVKPMLTPRFTPSCTDELMAFLGTLAAERDLPVQSHLSENRSEIAWVGQLHPECASYTEVYRDYGLLRRGCTIMAHAVHLTGREEAILREEGVTLAHCAQSNTNLSSGVMPLRRSLSEGLRCCVASDVAGGHAAAMNRHVAATVGLSKLRALDHPEERPLSLPEALYLATKGPGEFFGKVGSFEPGYDFDALVVDVDELDGRLSRTPFEKLEQFLYDGDDRDILARYSRGSLVEKPFTE